MQLNTNVGISMVQWKYMHEIKIKIKNRILR